MTQQISIWGATYSDVPAVTLPTSENGLALFTDVTDTTAAASDVAQGKYFYTAAGVKTEGTSTGGGGTQAGTVTQDANGYIVLDDDPPAGPTLITKSITANGTYNASSDNADGYSSVTVNVSGGGGGSGSMSDPIRFFDYDGTLVASYTAVPASLPSVPSHTGLTNGTWNYTLQQVTTQFNAMGTCDVGANYTTSSGATEIDVEFVDSARLSPYLRFAVKGTVTIDWGDGSTIENVTGTSLSIQKNNQHTYSQAGNYTIKLTLSSGTAYAMYANSSGYTLLHNNINDVSANRVYSSCVKSVRIGNSCELSVNALYGLPALQSVSIPSTANITSSLTFNSSYALMHVAFPPTTTSFATNACSALKTVSIPPNATIGTNTFYQCYALERVSLPSGTTSIGTSAFSTCYILQNVVIPTDVTAISMSTFSGCHSLSVVTIPSGVTSIGSSAFSNCYGVKEYHILPTTPPTLSNINAFNNISSDCVIYVPSASLSDYQTTSNWATYASRMVGE